MRSAKKRKKFWSQAVPETHKSKENKLFKAVLYGLPKTDVDEIKQYFKNQLNLVPIEVFEMKTKSTDPNRAIYLFHFDKNIVSRQILQQIKTILNVVVRWAAYSPKYKGPTQCRNCTMYGHGADNCCRKAICVFCFCETKSCPMNPTNASTSTIVPGAVFKCHNCVQNNLPNNHAATGERCPERNKYLSIRQIIQVIQDNLTNLNSVLARTMKQRSVNSP